jgi:GTP-binding protein
VPFERGGQRYELIDTAGLRRKGKVFEAIEKFSVVKTLQAIESANVVLLLLDATQGVTDQDAHIAGYILESGRAVVLAINKWDAVDAYQREQVQRQIESRLAFLKFAACT